MGGRNNTEITYLNHLQNIWYANEKVDIQDIHRLLNNFKSASNPFTKALPLLFIIDYTAKQYLLMSDAIIGIAGYHPREFLDSKMDKLMDVFHKDDFAIFNNKLFKRNAAFLSDTPFDEHEQYVFSYNFRFANIDKKYSHILQRSTYITSKETGLPLYNVGVIIDITHIKNDPLIIHTIEKSSNPYSATLIEKNFYYPNEEDTLLTIREKDILKHMADGLSSKQIASKFKISENTIGNHRQNMLRKTNTKNVAELVAFAIRNYLI